MSHVMRNPVFGVCDQGRMSTAPYSTWSGNTVSSSVVVHPASLGKALCLLARSDFMERLPRNGDVLYNCLQRLISKSIGGGMIGQYNQATTTGIVGSPLPCTDNRSSLPSDSFPTSLLLVSSSSSPTSHTPVPETYVPLRPFIPIQPRLGQSTVQSLSVASPGLSRSSPNLPLKVVERMSLDDDSLETETGSPNQSRVQSPGITLVKKEPRSSPDPNIKKDTVYSIKANRSADCRLLWEFIHQLLLDTKFSKYVCWENREDYVFRIANPTGLAELWGQQKNRTNMTYEKLSRALRYYYRMNIIRKVPGKRLTYKFLQPPSMIQKGQRGAKPHSKIHLPSTAPSLGNETGIKYEVESDFDSTPSDMDSPENPESKQSRQSSFDSEDDYKHNNGKHIIDTELPSNRVTNPNVTFPYQIPFGYAPGFGRNFGPRGCVTSFDSRHADTHYLNLNSSNKYYNYNTRDGLADKARGWIKSEANTDFHVGKIIRPRPSYPSVGEDFGSYDCLKQGSNLERTHSTNSNDYPSGVVGQVLRLPIDTLYRSQSCELPLKENKLTVPHLGQRPGHARSASPRGSGDFQSEPEDLSVKKNIEIKSYDEDLDNVKRQCTTSVCNSDE